MQTYKRPIDVPEVVIDGLHHWCIFFSVAAGLASGRGWWSRSEREGGLRFRKLNAVRHLRELRRSRLSSGGGAIMV